MFQLPKHAKLAGNWTPKRRTPLVFISQPGFLLWRHRGARSRGGSRSQRSVSLIASEKIASTTAGTEDIYLPHGIQIQWKFNFADRVIATITQHLCCCSMCITLQRCDSQEMNCNDWAALFRHCWQSNNYLSLSGIHLLLSFSLRWVQRQKLMYNVLSTLLRRRMRRCEVTSWRRYECVLFNMQRTN